MNFEKENINTENILKKLEELHLSDDILLEQIPNLDLYMDQVITLFENNLAGTKRNEEDKLLTKTMINNYTKDKLLMGAVKKKYTREHIILMILIYNLKQSIAINDIKSILNPIVEKVGNNEKVNLEELYLKYLKIKKENSEHLKTSMQEKLDVVKENDGGLLLYILSLIDMANGYRKLAENLIDNYFPKVDK
ncbi:hypothetical protein CPJCM30710_12680 [Clostridium polyendosporum]|uniref:DUF1836 domain-containing protein n=1 Tax=Clostridium polyendosporum TaxID=69208 RepID=A0A919RY36_9CLOT|nr:DUF1836 domain-containing protein [Clostridium polyendosporum]GIM28602.1 hypothetical protein CPJCM30710_12680 [Clostridium polyendosporum]